MTVVEAVVERAGWQVCFRPGSLSTPPTTHSTRAHRPQIRRTESAKSASSLVLLRFPLFITRPSTAACANCSPTNTTGNTDSSHYQPPDMSNVSQILFLLSHQKLTLFLSFSVIFSLKSIPLQQRSCLLQLPGKRQPRPCRKRSRAQHLVSMKRRNHCH